VLSALFLSLIIGGLVAIAWRDPRSYGLGILCPTKRVLGVYCPGCGATRATFDLMHGMIGSAIANNPLAVFVGVPVLAWLVLNLALASITGRAWCMNIPRRAGSIAAAALVLYGIARNLPLSSLDVLRPPTYPTPATITNPTADQFDLAPAMAIPTR
jgi:hypothetical protein